MNITCVVVSYRYGHLVAHAVETVLNQTRPPEEVFVVDDGAHDCDHIPKIYPEVTFIRRPKNLGIVSNFNDILFNHVLTPRVMFLGADNWLDACALEVLSRFKEDIVSYDGITTGSGRDVTFELPYQAHGSALYSVELARKVGGYEASGGARSEEDSVLFKKMRDAGATFYRVKSPLFHYRTHRRNFNQ